MAFFHCLKLWSILYLLFKAFGPISDDVGHLWKKECKAAHFQHWSLDEHIQGIILDDKMHSRGSYDCYIGVK